ncbi:MAG: hypothetical protein IPP88_04730 [Betaproteobacteria bacterium]|nr:hypothetical protein [Betaproteobacteria bacterium]
MTHRNRPADKPAAKPNHVRLQGDRERQTNTRDNTKARIAQSAARLIAEGQTDYQAAKRKAARQHGVTDRHALPDNHDVELALREHFALFSADAQSQALAALRETAIRLMSRLEQFSPWLVGAVLNGTANAFSEIELELVGIEPKDFEIYLLNAGVEYELCDPPRPRRVSAAQKTHGKYCMEFDEAPVTVTLYEHHAARLSANAGDPIKNNRAQRVEAENRFLQEKAKP